MAKNRQYRRKMHEKVDSIPSSFDGNVKQIFIVILVIAVVLVVFYFLTVYILSKDTSTSEFINSKPEEADIQYQEILAGNSFDIDEDNYYVLYYDMSDENLKSFYTNMITTYEEIDTHLPIYTVDMSSTFNKKYVSDEANYDVSKVEDLKISGPTLIEFDSSKVVEYVEGKDDIQQKLNEG